MSLLSPTHPTSDSGLTVSLHPLILLTISDYITRHTLRHQPRPIVGALLGQQNGRAITLEHAFECETVESNSTSASSSSSSNLTTILLHQTWFKDRLQQYKDVHKSPPLELVGWFTTTPVTGPEAAQLPIHTQILQAYNETAVLLAFHPSNVIEGGGDSVGGKLPLTIYESVYESAGNVSGGDGEGAGAGTGMGAMDVDTEDGMEGSGVPNANARLDLRFRELAYSVETGEAEMIGVDFVARGGANATGTDAGADAAAPGIGKTAGKGAQQRGQAAAAEGKSGKESKAMDDSLSVEDEELIASLTARANAVRMLHTRISLLKSYLNSLPPSYLTTTTTTSTLPSSTKPHQQSEPNHPLLRSISALLSRLPLLLPASPASLSTFSEETLAEKSDVELVTLLGVLGRSVRDAKELGRKYGIVEGVRSSARKIPGGGGGGGGFSGPGGLDLTNGAERRGGGDFGVW